RRALPRAARAWRARRHRGRGRHGDLALLRLADRQGRRLGRGPPGRDRTGPPRAVRALDRGAPDDPGASAGHPLERAVRLRPLLDELPRRGRGPAPGAVACMSGRRKQTGRRAARRSALFLLYNWDLTGKPLEEQSDEPVDPFALELAEGVVARAPE